MKLHDLALLGADTVRTRGYLQLLIKNNYYINNCYIMTNHPDDMEKSACSYSGNEEGSKYFEKEEPILYTLHKAEIPYRFLMTDDINSDICLNAVGQMEESNLIYSGFGGQIIGEPVFKMGKTLIHVHSGILPEYRGSTTLYYSLLKDGYCGASAIKMCPGLDEGDVIAEERFPMPPGNVDIDYIYDPYIRAKVLVKAIESYLEKGRFSGTAQGIQGAKTYFVIHPVLRHIVKLAQEGGGSRFENSL